MRRVRANIPIEQPTTVTLSVQGCLGGCSARCVQGLSTEDRPYVLYHAYGTKDKNCQTGVSKSGLGTKRKGRPSADDPCTPRAEQPPRQPRTLSATVVGCSTGIWARPLRVDRGMDGFRGPSGAHFVVCSLLVVGPKHQILPSRRFCATETPEKRNAWMRNG